MPTIGPSIAHTSKNLIFFIYCLLKTLSELSKILFVDASSRIQTWFFPQRMNNTVMLWAVLNGTLGLILFFIPKILLNKNFNLNQSKWGLKISSTQLVKTGLLSLLIFFLYFLILNVLYYLFHVDYRLLFIGIRTFNPITILLIPMYVPFFFIFFFAKSIQYWSSFKSTKILSYFESSITFIL